MKRPFLQRETTPLGGLSNHGYFPHTSLGIILQAHNPCILRHPRLPGAPSSAFTVPSNAKVPLGAGPKPARKSARAAALCFTRKAWLVFFVGVGGGKFGLDTLWILWPHESWRQKFKNLKDWLESWLWFVWCLFFNAGIEITSTL